MSGRNYEWDPRPPNARERLVAGLWLAAFTAAQASYFAGWRLFGDHDKQVAAGLTLIGLVLLLRMFPGVRRV